MDRPRESDATTSVQAAEIVREYGPFSNAPRVAGVTFDGTHVWFASGDALHAFDPSSGEAMRAISVAADAGTAFVNAAARETRPYLGDTWAFAMMQRMARAGSPLLDVEPADRPVDRHTRLRLTETGAHVLAGEVDHVARNGVDRWIGGVHLQGHHVPWRWNDGTERLEMSHPARPVSSLD